MKSKNWFDQLLKDNRISFKVLQGKLGFRSKEALQRLRKDPFKMTFEQILVIAEALSIDDYQLFVLMSAEKRKTEYIKNTMAAISILYKRNEENLL